MSPKKRNYPGDLRKPGTKDYGVILSFLINYRNQLMRTDNEEELQNLYLKISEKLQELGYKRDSSKVKTKSKQLGKLAKHKDTLINLAAEKWREAKAIHEQVKAEQKAREKEEKKRLREENNKKKNQTK